jgi:hypothetical protein
MSFYVYQPINNSGIFYIIENDQQIRCTQAQTEAYLKFRGVAN